ncbi:MAG: leucine-rich repeat domain-containing protein [Clostridia bacterium]|nr:leucine-rich repeat domain-containing protein [Clostridia bacterium]
MKKSVLLKALIVLLTLCATLSFSVACSKKHSCSYNIEGEQLRASTCIEMGEKVMYCSCGQSITVSIPKANHEYGEGIVTKAADCKNQGEMVYRCEVCLDEKKQTIPATGEHDYAEIMLKQPTCTEYGENLLICTTCEKQEHVKISKSEHVNVQRINISTLRTKATCESSATYWYSCDNCGSVSSSEYFEYGEALNHDWANDYSCVQNYCLNCEEKADGDGKHLYGEWQEAPISLCSATPILFHACVNCGYIEDAEGSQNAILHHDIEFLISKDATCEEGGEYTIGCKNCDFIQTTYTDALGHSYKWVTTSSAHKQVCKRHGCSSVIDEGAHVAGEDATCTQDQVCIYCDYVITPHTGHAYTELADKDPTCTQSGYKNAMVCDNCGYLSMQFLPASHKYVYVKGIEATCTQNGVINHYNCTSCNKLFNRHYQQISNITIPATGHNLDEVWVANKTQHYHVCITCNEKQEVGAHSSSGPATEKNAEVCTVCGYEIAPKLKHNHKYTHSVVAPTCISRGYDLHKCENCKYSYKDNFVSATGHNYVNYTVKTVATCEGAEISEGVCSVCGAKNSKTTGEKLGHIISAWQYGTEYECPKGGYMYKICLREGCGIIIDEKNPNKGEHRWSNWIYELNPTCNQTGLKHKECTLCGAHTQSEEDPILGHDYRNYTTVIQPTCESSGIGNKTCSRCGDVATYDKEALGHILEDVIDKAPSCIEEGSAHKQCKRKGCLYKEASYGLPIVDHEYKIKVDVEPSCFYKGHYVKICACGKISESGDLDETNHVYEKIYVIETTCDKDGRYYERCKFCHLKKQTQTEDAYGHNFGSWQTEIAAKCVVPGVKKHECSRCLLVERELIPATDHKFVKYEKDDYCHWLKCSNGSCPERTGYAVHSYSVSEKSLTQYGGGKITYTHWLRYTCDVCDYYYDGEKISNVKHNSVSIKKGYPATCTENGLTYGIVCAVANCGKVILEQQVIPATGHKQSDWHEKSASTCTKAGEEQITCVYCCAVLQIRSKDILQHVAGSMKTVKWATCEQAGLKQQKCLHCGIILKEETISAKGHEYSTSWSFNGETHYQTCLNGCGLKRYEESHEFREEIASYSYSENGIDTYKVWIEYTCSCGYSYNSDVATVIQHNLFKIIPAKEPTCTEQGHSAYVICAVEGCDDVLIEPSYIDPLGHDLVDGKCTRCGYEQTDNKYFIFELLDDDTYSVKEDTRYVNSLPAKIIIPSTYQNKPVTTIAEDAFTSCNNMEEIVIPNSITRIENYVFYQCYSLQELIIPDSVKYIGDGFARECISIKNVKIPNDFTYISGKFFAYCTALENIEIPSTVTVIDSNAFRGCESLTSIVIPISVNMIWDEAFAECPSLIVFCESTNKDPTWNAGWEDSLVYYYKETQPTESGNYWHYVDGIPTIWEIVVEETAFTRDGDYIYMGLYPQTIKADNITISSIKNEQGYFLGSDNEWYAKVVATPSGTGYKFSNSTTVISNNVYYFKVEPIKWRIITDGIDGIAYLLCESVIDSKRYDDDSNDYDYSEIKAWINEEFYNVGFNDLQKGVIVSAYVNNNSSLTSIHGPSLYVPSNEVFLLSYYELTKNKYLFNTNETLPSSNRSKKASDYAICVGAIITTNTDYYGYSSWYLRTITENHKDCVMYVNETGVVNNSVCVYEKGYGIAPVLYIRLRESNLSGGNISLA